MSSSCRRIIALEARQARILPAKECIAARISSVSSRLRTSAESGAAARPAASIMASKPRPVERVTSWPRDRSAAPSAT